MKRNCKTCTLNTTNDTVETCKRMCYLRYSKQRNKRICDLEQEIQKLKSENKHLNDLLNQALKELEKTRETLTEIKEITENGKRFAERYMITGEQKANVLTYANAILQKISECEGNDEN